MNMYPQEFLDIAKQATIQNPDSIEDAVLRAEESLANAGFLEQHATALIRDGIRCIIHHIRNTMNERMVRAATGNPVKQKITRDSLAHLCTEHYLEQFVDGKRLGSWLGRELPRIADKYEQQGRGALKVCKMLRLIIPLVPDDKAVSECLDNNQVRQIMVRAETVSVHIGEMLQEERITLKTKKPKAANGRKLVHA